VIDARFLVVGLVARPEAQGGSPVKTAIGEAGVSAVFGLNG
jgi:hypothetical protein